MKIQSTSKLSVFILALVFSVFVLGQANESESNKWRIKFDHNAKSDGEIVFTVRPDEGDPMNVNVKIEDGTHENHVAKVVEKAFKTQLPKKQFHIQRDDWEDVLLKKDRIKHDFDLELASNSVEGLKITIHKE